MVNQAERIEINDANTEFVLSSILKDQSTARKMKMILKDMERDHARVLTKMNVIIGLQIGMFVYLLFHDLILRLVGI